MCLSLLSEAAPISWINLNPKITGSGRNRTTTLMPLTAARLPANFRLRTIQRPQRETFRSGLQILDAEVGVPDLLSRTVNLSGATSATLTFDYRRDIPSGQADDQFFVLASKDGVNFTQIGQIGATGNASFVDGSYPLSRSIYLLTFRQTRRSDYERARLIRSVDSSPNIEATEKPAT